MAITKSSTRSGIHASAPRVSTPTTRTGGDWSSAGEESYIGTPVAPTGSTIAPNQATPFTFTDHTKGSSSTTPISDPTPTGGWFGGGGTNITKHTPVGRTKLPALSATDIESKYGIKGKFGSVFTGELEAMFGTLEKWNESARPKYNIFSDGLPTNLGEAYTGLEQALKSQANQVTEIQVLTIDMADELETTVGATVYYYQGRKLGEEPKDGSAWNEVFDKQLIQQKEILDTYRPFAMARVQEAIDMKNEVTLQGIEDAFERARDESQRTFDVGVQERKQKHDAALAVSKVKATGVEARATAQVTGQEDRQTLNLKYQAEADQAVKDHERDLEIMENTLWNEQEKIRASTEASRYLNQLSWELEMASTEQKQSFAANQASQDRALKMGELEQAGNLQLQANILQAEMMDMQNQQHKMDWVMGLISNPITLYMVQKAGLLGTIGNLGGADVESAVSKVLAAVPEQSLSNIQNLNARSDFENEIDSFNISMQRGMSPEAYRGYISGTAPYTRGQESRMAAGRPTDYSEFIQGPTTQADLEGPDIQSGFYQPDPMGNLEGIMKEGEAIRTAAGEKLQGFDTTAAYKMAQNITGAEAPSYVAGMGEEAMESRAQADRDDMGYELYTGFTMDRPNRASFQTKGGNAQMFLLDDAPTQIIRAIPDISMNEAQEMARKALNVAGSDEQFGETDEDIVQSAYGIVQSWVRGYGVYAVNGVWFDRNEELGRGREGQKIASTRRESYREELGDPAKGTGALFREARK